MIPSSENHPFVSGIKGLIPNCYNPQAHLQFQSGHTGWKPVVDKVKVSVVSLTPCYTDVHRTPSLGLPYIMTSFCDTGTNIMTYLYFVLFVLSTSTKSLTKQNYLERYKRHCLLHVSPVFYRCFLTFSQ